MPDGVLGDILGVVTEVGEYATGDWGKRYEPVARYLTGEYGARYGVAGERPPDPDTDDVLAALLREKAEDVLALSRSVRTTEDLLALDQARTELIQLGTDLPVLREKIGLLENLPEFSEDATSEEIISAFAELTPQLAIEAEEDAALSPEDQAFADLQTRSMELDVSLKEQDLASQKMANQQAGMMSLLNMLPASARTETIATIMETPTLREQLFPGLFGGGGGAALGGSAEGDVFEILKQFGGEE